MSIIDRLRRVLGTGGEEQGQDVRQECGSCRPISCREALEKVHEYLDGELDESEAAGVAYHFQVCKECFPHLRLEERFRDLLRGAGTRETCPEDLKNRVLDLLKAEGTEG